MIQVFRAGSWLYFVDGGEKAGWVYRACGGWRAAVYTRELEEDLARRGMEMTAPPALPGETSRYETQDAALRDLAKRNDWELLSSAEAANLGAAKRQAGEQA